MNNARQYSTSTKTIFDIEATLNDIGVVVRIKNSGKLKRHDFQDVTKHFKVVSQLHTIENKKGGLGLGLYIARKAAEKIKAALTLESEHPIVCVRLDTPFRLTPPDASGVKEVISNRKVYRILLIEDNLILQKILRAQLMRRGYQILTADDGEQAVQLYSHGEPFNLIITDLNLPNKSGVDLSHDVREFERKNNMHRAPIVALTAAFIRNQAQFCHDNDMDAFIQKPISITNLDKILLDILKRQEHSDPVDNQKNQQGGSRTPEQH